MVLTSELTALELQHILCIQFYSGGSMGLCPLPSKCVDFLPLVMLQLVVPWLSLPGRGLPTAWQWAAPVPVWKGKGSPTDVT